jgi:nitrogen fixation NifU-like protein
VSLSVPYGPKILEHFRKPRNRGALPGAQVSQEGHNPLCGDRVRIELLLDGDVIENARFTANACAVCVAAASVMTELIRGAPLEDVASLTLPEVLAALEADLPSARLACARLPLTVLHTALTLHERRTAPGAG